MESKPRTTRSPLAATAKPPGRRRAAGARRLPSRKVAFLGDLARFTLRQDLCISNSSRNVRWLAEIVTAADAWRQEGLRIELLLCPAGPLADLSQVGDSATLQDYEQDPELAWAARFDRNQLDVFPGLLAAAAKADLVVGYELPPAVKRQLHAKGVSYVSFHVHALRMLRDLCLGACTNDIGIARALAAVAVSADEVTRQVRRFRALCRFHRMPALQFPADVPVLIGQTPRDSILIDRGRFADWTDHEDRLAAELTGHDTCIVLHHPFSPGPAAACELLRSRLGKTVIATNANGYGTLLSDNSIPFVLTLSSSLGVEADAFGLPCRFLLGDPRDRMLLAGVDVGVTHALGHGVLSNAFWTAVLEGAPMPVPEAGHDQFPLGDHYLRDSLESWSYQLLRNRLQGAQSRKTLMPAPGLTAKRQSLLVQQLLGATDSAPSNDIPFGVELILHDPPLQIGQKRCLRGDAAGFAALLGQGFHATDPWGVWAGAGSCELVLPLVASAGARLQVELQLRCFEGVLERCPVLEIRSGARLLGAVMFRPIGMRAATVCVTLDAAASPVILELLMSDAVSPAAVGLGPDPRPLGFGLTQIDLQLLAPSSACDVPTGVSIWGVPDAQGDPIALPLTLGASA